MDRSRIRALIAVAAAAVAALVMQSFVASGPARAMPPFEQGLADYEAGRYPQALIALHEAAAADNPRAQEMLGWMYLIGPSLYPGVPRDLRAATQWLDRAAGHGSATSSVVLCALHRHNRQPIATADPCRQATRIPIDH